MSVMVRWWIQFPTNTSDCSEHDWVCDENMRSQIRREREREKAAGEREIEGGRMRERWSVCGCEKEGKNGGERPKRATEREREK